MTPEGRNGWVCVAFAAGVVLLVVLIAWAGLSVGRAYLVAVSVATFGLFGLDKLQAIRS